MSQYPAHTQPRRAGLAALLTARANPAAVQEYLTGRFERVRVLYVLGQRPFYYALECRDSSDAIRLAVLFWHDGAGWNYDPLPARRAAKLRTEEPA